MIRVIDLSQWKEKHQTRLKLVRIRKQNNMVRIVCDESNKSILDFIEEDNEEEEGDES